VVLKSRPVILVVKGPVDVVPPIMLSVSVGVALALLHTIPLFVTVAPPSLTIVPPDVAPLVVILVNTAVVTVGAIGGGGGALSFLHEMIVRVITDMAMRYLFIFSL
jgi:hypothetical protein